MILLGYFFALLMGFILGLLGGGGSILSVPILVYVFHIPANIASGYSLFIVGVTALIGTYRFYKQDLIDIKKGLLFALPAFVGVYISRRWLVPSLPDTILQTPLITKDQLILIVFSLLMLSASILMIRGGKTSDDNLKNTKEKPLRFTLQGFAIGLLTGFVGAGGGFLIIPSLVILGKVDMKVAIGTSLMIITLNSLIGFLGDLSVHPTMDWKLLVVFSLFAIVGMLFGNKFNTKVSGKVLKRTFGFFVLIMGLFILLKELF